jgi:hypothetical protein
MLDGARIFNDDVKYVPRDPKEVNGLLPFSEYSGAYTFHQYLIPSTFHHAYHVQVTLTYTIVFSNYMFHEHPRYNSPI